MRLYFHVFDGSLTREDTCGLEVADLEEARQEAWSAVQEFMAESEPGDLQGWVLNVVDDAGRLILSIPLDNVRH
jgi:hypothetical protein